MDWILLSSVFNDLWTVISLFYLVWIYSWAKTTLGSPKLAILLAVIVVYLTFYSHPELVWIALGVFLLGTFGKDFIGKLSPFRVKETADEIEWR